MGLVVLVEAEFGDRVEVIDVLDLCVDSVVDVKVRVHVITEHETAEIFLRCLNEGGMNTIQNNTIQYKYVYFQFNFHTNSSPIKHANYEVNVEMDI